MKKQDLQLLWLFCGCLIGAGFASGQELWQYFARFGWRGWFGAVGAVGGFMLFFALICRACRKSGVRSQQQFLQLLFPRFGARFFDLLLSLFLYATLVAMLSAAGTACREQLGIAPIYGIWGCAVVVWCCLALRSDGVLGLQKFLVPPILLLMSWVGWRALCVPLPSADSTALCNAAVLPPVTAAVLYVSYNLASGLGVLLACGELCARSSRRLPLLVGAVLAMPLLLVTAALIQHGAVVSNYALPAFYLAFLGGRGWFYLYSGVLAAALLTTAVGCGLALVKRLVLPQQGGLRGNWLFGQTMLLVTAIPCAFTEFPLLIAKLYSVFALLFLPIWLILLLTGGGRRHKNT